MDGNDLKLSGAADGKDLDTDGNDLEKKTKRSYRSTHKNHPYHYLGVVDLKRMRQEWGMSFRDLGDLIGVRGITVRCWEEEYNPIPSPVAMLLQILVDISGTRYGEEKFGLDEEISFLEEE